MPYRGIVLPATGGGAVLAAGVALALQQWVLAVVFGLLAFMLLGFWRLRKGEHDLGIR